MNVENNLTAHQEGPDTKDNDNDADVDGCETITINANFGDEDEDVHKCGRCQKEFFTLEAFIQHKLRQDCRRETSCPLQEQMVSAVPTTQAETPDGGAREVVSDERESAEADDGALGRGRRKKSASLRASERSEDSADGDKLLYKVNVGGRYLCQLCDKTFKTSNILKTHMKTHSDQKNFACQLCGDCFRTKGSLIRHNRRHSDERPYRCALCGQSFRESGALTRHLKSLTPCTEKIRFFQCKEILVSKDGMKKGLGESPAERDERAAEAVAEAQTAVVSLVEAGSQEVIRQVHFTVEVDGAERVTADRTQAETLAVSAGDDPLCRAVPAPRTEEAEPAVDPLDKMLVECPVADGVEIQVKEELVEAAAQETGQVASKLYPCPHCKRSFKGLNYFRFHVKGHSGYKPFKCTLCQRDFLSGYLLKKHMEVHVSERRYKCGECGKLYKSVGHVREHMRAHSDERPYACARCHKSYKTKNALQVHQRTHGQEKPYVCQVCFRGFREKGSLVRHTRHHTGEKPFKCPKCGRGFAEHGTLNRHVRAKGGCHKDDPNKQQREEAASPDDRVSSDELPAATIVAEDPHALLVEFSSVVADTQEYIIKTHTDEAHEEEVTFIRDGQSEMGEHIVKVVQQMVNGSHGGHRIILRNVRGGGEEGAAIVDCGDTITIAAPESLTEQVAATLASAIDDGTLLAGMGAAGETLAVVTTAAAEEEYVLTAPQEVEIRTVVV
ncbi:transcription factor E4F1 isoform X2 [Stigmatopora argus]